ncbi:MAG: general secretion pathway protein GspK, partial [Planctomycetes bacterium]|nr:general secretion pathway protein GspK [Planctomycetota bacterium]
VMIVVILELTSTTRVQAMIAENITDSHMAFYAVETAMIETEEYLYQDLQPPPRRPDTDLSVEENQKLMDQQISDSYHDFWAREVRSEKVGDLWAQTAIFDEERKFNINSLVDPGTGTPRPGQKQFLEALLEKLGMRRAMVPDLVEEIIDYIDKDTKGKFDGSDKRNAPMGMVRECLLLENVSRSLYFGSLTFPKGELPIPDEDSEFVDEFEEETDEEALARRMENPFAPRPVPPLEEWEERGIRAGLRDILTVYGDGLININTAPLPILEALFDEREVALDVIKKRKKAPLKSPEDLKDISGVQPGIAKYGALIGFKSQFFRVEMVVKHRRTTRKIFAIIRRWNGKVMTLFRGPRLQ